MELHNFCVRFFVASPVTKGSRKEGVFKIRHAALCKGKNLPELIEKRMVHFKHFRSPKPKLLRFKKFNEPFPIHRFNRNYLLLMLLYGSPQGFRRLDLLLQQTIDQRSHVFVAPLRGLCQPGLHAGIEINRQIQSCAGPIEFASFRFREVIFLFHFYFERYFRASVFVALRAEIMRQRAAFPSTSCHV